MVDYIGWFRKNVPNFTVLYLGNYWSKQLQHWDSGYLLCYKWMVKISRTKMKQRFYGLTYKKGSTIVPYNAHAETTRSILPVTTRIICRILPDIFHGLFFFGNLICRSEIYPAFWWHVYLNMSRILSFKLEKFVLY